MCRLLRVAPILLWTAALGPVACVAETDRGRYVAGDLGTTSFENQSRGVVWLEGCSAYALEQWAGDRWTPGAPAQVCVWEGFARPVLSDERLELELRVPDEPGHWRVVYPVGLGCESDQPLAPESCVRIGSTASPPFEVSALCATRACGPALGMPNVLCPDGESIGGPTGRCLRDPEADTCGWEIAECPAEP
jgi:hypothetical protein